MKVIVKHRLKGGKIEFVKGRERDEKDKLNLVFTDKQDEAKLWNTLYAATDFISKSDTELEGFEIIQIDDKDLAHKTAELKSKQKYQVESRLVGLVGQKWLPDPNDGRAKEEIIMMKWRELADRIEKNIDSLACFPDDPVSVGVVEGMIKNFWESLSPVQQAKRMLYWTIEDLIENAEIPEIKHTRIDEHDNLFVELSEWTPKEIKKVYGYEPHESIADTVSEVLNEYWEVNQFPPHNLVVVMNYLNESNEWKVDLLTEEEINQFYRE